MNIIYLINYIVKNGYEVEEVENDSYIAKSESDGFWFIFKSVSFENSIYKNDKGSISAIRIEKHIALKGYQNYMIDKITAMINELNRLSLVSKFSLSTKEEMNKLVICSDYFGENDEGRLRKFFTLLLNDFNSNQEIINDIEQLCSVKSDNSEY